MSEQGVIRSGWEWILRDCPRCRGRGRVADEAGRGPAGCPDCGGTGELVSLDVLRAAEQARAEEREACARVAESWDFGLGLGGNHATDIAKEIRARAAGAKG